MYRLGGCLVVSLLALGLSAGAEVGEKQTERVVNRPRVPGRLRLHLRERREEPHVSGKVKVVERTDDWETAETAIIVCDMWDDHYCKRAAQRVKVMVPHMNEVLTKARDHGVMIIHARSEERRVGKECRTRWSPDH